MPDNREIVLEALLLYEKGEYADKIIKSILDKYSYLERFERGFINRVFTGTIERRLSLDFIINNFSSVKVNKQKTVIRTILRMSTYQLLYMDSVPDSAVINEAVKLAKKKKFQGLTGFVNGVLRKIARDKDSVSYPDKDKETTKYLSVMYSCPEWICKHFIDECGLDNTEKILANSLVKRPVIIRPIISKITKDELVKKLVDENITVKNIELPEHSVLYSYCDDYNNTSAFIIDNIDGLNAIDSFEEGLFSVQDLSSQMVLNNEKVNETLKQAKLVVDVCAAPGGKTCHAADMLRFLGNDSCKVISRDLTDNKVEKIEENLDRLGFDNVETQVRDALLLDDTILEKADIVIADLPCSGLGVIGRKVDIKYRIQPDDLKTLATLQKEILKVVSQYVKPGGMLIYSTCTVNSEENINNADWIENNLPFSKFDDPLQILNNVPEHDGFFISRFIKE